MDTLLSFVGNRDPYADDSGEYRPVLSLLRALPHCIERDYCIKAFSRA